ncbi:histidine kinase dimerization/phosphoacceptor domain -containing protein [Lichenihabitans sp. Uapishka_5]|uniref:histidine kinase dimerization/phosphoacceptor domain -containing protein n=1 Tax=Lichenihabitans sp. Uapishka_5 TaxID=3037302 RepID=UPI0029E8153F|nr:histidine kinase dimerization/phosphoacceptor domain -containing protein [Lichenihabitans sp. Uapishka_5]MDX7951525.1 histidine kinase dimerization/phosphoacceptor domain -containing protein [Lichenihabitans sp. Uapishka_5]
MEASTSTPVQAQDLDGLTSREIDELRDCVFKVDVAGRLVWCNAAARQLCGLPEADLGAIDFFAQLIPAARQPAFLGRFRAGLRRGVLDARFPFLFGFEPPIRAQVALLDSATPGHYWIVFEAVVALAATRQRHAALASEAAQVTVERRSRAEPIDAGVCEREPIHIPGAIQPYANLLVLDPGALRITAFSDGCLALFGRDGAELIGGAAEAVLPMDLLVPLRAALADEALATPGRPWRRIARLGGDTEPFLVSAHRHDDAVMIEFEMAPDRADDYGPATALDAQEAVTRIRAAADLTEAATACADEVRAMTGFERVLVYRFDVDWNGEAIAESLVADYPSLLGLRFPASDIPAQARALYTKAPARFVVDRDATPAAVLAAPAAANQAVDLTFVPSRALSPIHLEYQRNLGVNGSMSVSILDGGRLWGLVIGHHRQPHYVAPETRAFAALVTDGFALRLHELESRKAWAEQQAALEVQNTLLRRLAGHEDFVAALSVAGAGATLRDLVEATGAAVVSADRVATVGMAPPADALQALAAWLRQTLPEHQTIFATADLSEHWAPSTPLRGQMSGLLAVFVGAERQHLLLWFRPEVTATVVWGGDPRKTVLSEVGSSVVLPRRSFERWVEERRGQAEAWASWQVSAAEALAVAIEGVVLRQGRKIAELSSKQQELTYALEQREILAREIDHRVKNSLQIVAGVMLMQARSIEDVAAKAAFQDTYTRVMSVARVHDALQHAHDAETVDLGETLRLLCGDIAASLSDTADRLSVAADPGVMVPSRTAVALSLIATELITNAFKYAYAPGVPGPVEVRVEPRGAGGLRLSVGDRGRGLPADWEAGPRKRGGLGMRVIRAMLARIDAEMSVEADDGAGTRFVIVA